jgi:hypothetical protein
MLYFNTSPHFINTIEFNFRHQATLWSQKMNSTSISIKALSISSLHDFNAKYQLFSLLKTSIFNL